MNRCITERLALMGRRCITSAPHGSPGSTGLSRTLWSLAHVRRVAPSPSSPLTTQLRHLCRRLSSASNGVSRQLRNLSWRPAVGRWRLSDRARERWGLALATSWFTMLTVQSECDEVDFELLVKNKILSPDEEQTGWDRLAAMYTLDEMGGLTPELELVASIGTAGLLIGGCLGAMLNARLAIHKFVERNQATPFESQLAAKRALQDRVTLGMARGFFMFGWRTALFTSAFTLVSTTLMVYTNQISALHYCAGGMTAGALYKANMGLRGMVAGAVAGGILGLVGGGLFSLTCYVTDTTLPKLRYQQYLWKHQQELRNKARAERKREKKQKEAEKKLEKERSEMSQSPLAASAAVASSTAASSSAGGFEEAVASPSTSSVEGTANGSSDGESFSVESISVESAGAESSSTVSDDIEQGAWPSQTETGLDAALSAAAAAVVGTAPSQGGGVSEGERTS